MFIDVISFIGMELIKLGKILYSKEVALEVIKLLLTALFGFVTFKIYQTYRNKQSNSILFIEMEKLEIELINNKDKLVKLMDMHDEYKKLKDRFFNSDDNSLMKLYSRVNELNLYVDHRIIREYGEPIDVEYIYFERKYEEIKNLKNYMQYLSFENKDNNEEINELRSVVKQIENDSIFDELLEINEMLDSMQMIDHHFNDALHYLSKKIKEFNSMEHHEKLRKLDDFCKNLLEEENKFSITLKWYMKLESLKKELAKPITSKKTPNTVTINFNLWNEQNYDLLIVYDRESYLELNRYYNKYKNIEVMVWDRDFIEKVNSQMVNIQNDHIKRIKNNLDKTLLNTKWLFGKT